MTERPFPGRRPPPDPHTFDYPATLKQYAEWFRFHYPQQAIDEDNADKAAEQEAGDGTKPRNGIKMRWEKYKKEFAAAQVSIISTWLVSDWTMYIIFATILRSVLVDKILTESFPFVFVASNHV